MKSDTALVMRARWRFLPLRVASTRMNLSKRSAPPKSGFHGTAT